MKFQNLKINQSFTMSEHPECVAIKIQAYKGSCCSEPHNAKLIRDKGGAVVENLMLVGNETDVVPVEEEGPAKKL